MSEAIAARLNENLTVAYNLLSAVCKRGSIQDGDIVQIQTRHGLTSYRMRMIGNRCCDVNRQSDSMPEAFPLRVADIISTSICKYFEIRTSDTIMSVYNQCDGNLFRTVKMLGGLESLAKEDESDLRTPLQHAIMAINEAGSEDEKQRAREGMQFVLSKGKCCPERMDQFGQTELHTVAEHGYSQLIPTYRKILEPHRLSTYNREGLTPLHLAVWNGHTETVISLLECGADVNARTNPNIPGFNESAVDFAISKLDYKMLQVLLSYGATPTFSVSEGCRYSPMERLERIYSLKIEERHLNRAQKAQLLDAYRHIKKQLKEHFLNKVFAEV
ncbi:ankyrin repeat domain-containing protein [Parashewanella tropica]|uniref:ankyrin repeat domain-containing protein n=1 Tax=Parashewanella tropica TaxID=2547970 RepID=UPI001059B887|nr:ankyrin repeat domain-containing protein [Parashewanella tropica]